ncbi:hypothetical protein HZA85_03925 [Candidatus Uhrbacteria bacterium]|nr:hypothetical protein [Candidatus Uhrbacteria bacterium]
MIKNFLFLLLIAGSIWGSERLFNPVSARASTSVPSQVSAPATQTARPSQSASASQEQNGITIEVTSVEQAEETTTVSLSLNNHTYDLSQEAIYETATLNGQPSVSHAFPSQAAGGHHVQVVMVFPKTTEGALVISPADGIVFTFEDLWK